MKFKSTVFASLFVLQSTALFAVTFDHFVTTWKTDNPGTSSPTLIPVVGTHRQLLI